VRGNCDAERVVDVLLLCTGNAARSVIAGAALSQRLPDVAVETAGTLTVDGQPMSWRTKAALEHVGVVPPTAHRSRQATQGDIDGASLVIGLAPEHVAWVRREHPSAAARTATLRRLCRDLPGTAGTTMGERIAALDLAVVALEDWEEIEDPGGGEAEDFVACAVTVVALVDALAGALAALA
jgi:protein-tyrosine-phosphatase